MRNTAIDSSPSIVTYEWYKSHIFSLMYGLGFYPEGEYTSQCIITLITSTGDTPGSIVAYIDT